MSVFQSNYNTVPVVQAGKPAQNVLRPPSPKTQCQLSLGSAQGHGVFIEPSPDTLDITAFSQNVFITGSQLSLV